MSDIIVTLPPSSTGTEVVVPSVPLDVIMPDGTTYTEPSGVVVDRTEEEDTGTGTATGFAAFTPQVLYAIGYDTEDDDDEYNGIVLVIAGKKNVDGSDEYVEGIEIWRRDIFSEDTFTKLATATYGALIAESTFFKEFLTNTLGTYNDSWMIFYDNDIDVVDNPTVYEYRVRFVKHPTDLDFSIGDVLAITDIPISEAGVPDSWDPSSEDSVLEIVAHHIYGETGADWVVGLLNPIDYFTTDQQALIDALNELGTLKVADSLEDVVELLRAMISQFGTVAVITKVFTIMGEISKEFLLTLIDALTTSFRAKTGTDIVTGDVETLSGISDVIHDVVAKTSLPDVTGTVSVLETPEIETPTLAPLKAEVREEVSVTTMAPVKKTATGTLTFR